MPDETSQDPDIEFSALSQVVTREGVSVRVVIYRISEMDGRWTLEVVDEADASTVWDDVFETGEEAFEVFEEALAAQGIRGLTETFH